MRYLADQYNLTANAKDKNHKITKIPHNINIWMLYLAVQMQNIHLCTSTHTFMNYYKHIIMHVFYLLELGIIIAHMIPGGNEEVAWWKSFVQKSSCDIAVSPPKQLWVCGDTMRHITNYCSVHVGPERCNHLPTFYRKLLICMLRLSSETQRSICVHL